VGADKDRREYKGKAALRLLPGVTRTIHPHRHRHTQKTGRLGGKITGEEKDLPPSTAISGCCNGRSSRDPTSTSECAQDR